MVNGIIDSGQEIVTSGLLLNYDVAQLRSYPTTGTNLTDLSGNNYTAVLTNGVAYNSGNGGNLVFDGVNDYLELGDVLDMGTNSYTISLWVNFNSLGTNGALLSKGLQGSQNYRFQTYCSTASKLAAFMQGNGGADVTCTGSTTITTNAWFMATFVYNRASSIQIYYNTNLETLTGSATISQWAGSNFQSSNPLRIAAYTAANNTTPANLLNGKIGTTLLYNRGLSSTEITQNYNAIKSRYGL